MASEKKDGLKIHLETLREDVEGSARRSSEQVKALKSGLDKLGAAVQFQGYLTVVAVLVLIFATWSTVQHKKALEQQSTAIENHERDFLKKPAIEDLAKTIAVKNNRTDDEIKAIADKSAKAAADAVPPRRTDDEIKAIAVKNNRTDDEIKAIALENNRSDTEIKAIALANNRTDDEIKAIALANNRTDAEIKAIADKSAKAAADAVPPRRTDAEIKAIALKNNRTDDEIKGIADKSAREAVAKVPPRRTNKEIKDIADGAAEAAVRKVPARRTDKEITALARKAAQPDIKDLKERTKQLRDMINAMQAELGKLEKQIAAAPKGGGDPKRAETLAALARGRDRRKPLTLPASVDLAGLDLSGADFTKARMTKINLSKADLRECNFRDALLDGVDLRGADLRGADLRIEGFKNIKLDGAVYNAKTQFDASFLDLDKLGAKKKR